MEAAPIPENEKQRIKDLLDLQILDSDSEERFNCIVRLAKTLFKTKIVTISFVDNDRQWFKASVGMTASATSREISFCGHAVMSDDLFVVEDAHKDEKFKDNPLVVGDPYVRFYAGIPIHGHKKFRVGTLCLMHDEPRIFTEEDCSILTSLGMWIESELNQKILDISLIELKEKNKKLEVINKLMVGRELKLADLESQLMSLAKRLKEAQGE